MIYNFKSHQYASTAYLLVILQSIKFSEYINFRSKWERIFRIREGIFSRFHADIHFSLLIRNSESLQKKGFYCYVSGFFISMCRQLFFLSILSTNLWRILVTCSNQKLCHYAKFYNRPDNIPQIFCTKNKLWLRHHEQLHIIEKYHLYH